MDRVQLNEISKNVLDACMAVHKEVGPGLLESVYEACLIEEFQRAGLQVNNQANIPIVYKDVVLSKNLRIDLLIENEIILEIKSVESLLPVHHAQLISYLRIADKKLGFLVNFNVPMMKQGIKRLVNNF